MSEPGAVKPVFLHISKNAGNSIRQAAGDAIICRGHKTARDWVAENGRQAPLFAVVRNPFDRVVSEYAYRRRRYLSNECNPHLANLGKPFEQWVISTFQDGEMRTRSFFERTGVAFNEWSMRGDCLIWFIPQTEWVRCEESRLLVDDILRYEHLESDWERFSRKYAINSPLARVNVSPRNRDFRSYYSNRTKQLIFDYYRSDFEAFGYEFQ